MTDLHLTIENACEPCGLFVTITLRPMDSSVKSPTSVRTECPVCRGPLTKIGAP